MAFQRKRFSIGLNCLVVMVLTTCRAGGAHLEVPDPSIMLPLVPAAAEANAPPCIKPGTRLTYFGMSASIPGEYKQLVQDDNGRWVDRNTGKRYDQQDIPSASGGGYNVVQVGYVGDGIAQLSTKLYTLDVSTGKCLFAAGGGLVAHAGCAADYWIHPRVLKQVNEMSEQGVGIMRMPYAVAGRQYNAIRFQTENAAGYQARVYDLETGLLIFHGSRTQGAPIYTPPISGSGVPGVGQGSTQLATGWIVEVKDIEVPWNTESPGWVSQFGMLTYRGTQTTEVAAAGSRLDRALTVSITPKARGSQWVRFTSRLAIETFQAMPPEQNVQEGACGIATVGGLWVSLEPLARLQPMQVIETNEHVGTTVTVGEVGNNFVTITENGPLHRIDCTYDKRTGVLSAMNIAQQMGLARITHSIKLTGQD